MMNRCQFSLVFLLTCLVLFISGCKVELYSNLPEREANEMLAILLSKGIGCDKIPGKEGTWGLSVGQQEIATAVQVLQDAGYPRDKFVNIGDMFKKEGLVSSPLEERVRFVYALSQEISETLSRIDGVLTARTQIVLPENNPLSDNLQPSSASVFIKHRQDADLESSIPKIKKLVVNSIEGLAYDKVTVVLFPSEERMGSVEKPPFKRVLGVKVATDSVRNFWILTGALLILFLLALGGAGYLYWANRTKGKQ